MDEAKLEKYDKEWTEIGTIVLECNMKTCSLL